MLTQRIQKVQPSSTLRISALAKELAAQGEKIINLASGEPDFDTPESIKEAAIQAIREGFTKYTPTTGIPELKKAIASAFHRSRGLTYDLKQIAVTCGAKQAIFNVLQVLVQQGDEVVVASPYWVSYPEMIHLAGALPVVVRTDPLDGFRLDAKDLSEKCTPRTRCLILNSPSNPTGAVLDRARLLEIAKVCEARNLWVLSDEIYSELVYDGEHSSIVSLSPEAYRRAIVVDGVSKAYAMTGWRIGYCAGPVEVIEAAGRLQDHSTSAPSSISQRAALAALTGDQGNVKQMVAEFKKRRDFLADRLSRIPGIRFVKPEGAFYCFIDISQTGLNSDSFSERCLKEAKVALIPGSGFGWDTHVRVSFATRIEALQEGLDRLEEFLRNLDLSEARH